MPKSYQDITGHRFGRLTVLGFADYDEHGNTMWKCRCDCGTVFVTRALSLRSGQTQSCGCLRRELASARCKKAKDSWTIPVAIIRGKKRTECESISVAAKILGCSHSTVGIHLRDGKRFKGYTIERLNTNQ